MFRSRRHRRRLVAPAARSVRAFTLLETIIALAILAVGVLGVATSLLTALKFSANSRLMTRAMYLADEQMETMRIMSAADVLALLTDPNYPNDPLNPIDPDPGDDDQTQFTRRWTIQPDTPETGLIAISVEVGFPDRRGIQRTVTLRSLKSGV